MSSIAPRIALAVLLFTGAAGLLLAAAPADPPQTQPQSPARWRQHDMRRPRPPVVTPPAPVPAPPPADAVVLFGGENLDAWQSPGGGPAAWKVVDGVMQTVPGAGQIETKQKFGDMQLHIEWSAPAPPHGTGQNRGNSGLFLMGQFEVQVLDSYQADTYADGQAGAIYGQFPPLANASRPPGEWQSYDIAFRRPRFGSDGTLVAPARITVFHNGLVVQDNEEPFGPTSWLKALAYTDIGGRGPIALQDHDHPVRYRNIWVRDLPERAAPTAADLARPAVVTLPQDLLDRYAGKYRLNPEGDAAATITREDGHLVVVFPFRPNPIIMEPISETEFDLPSTDARFTFHRDADGKVTGVHFHVGDGEREMPRAAD